MTIDNLPRRDITHEEARRRTDEFKVHTEAWLEELAALYIDQVWRALDYETFDEYCAAELGSIRLPRAGRTEAVLTLRDADLSIRAISSALGLGRGTVEREITAGQPDGPRTTIVGADGKYYPATSPTAEIEVGVPDGTPTPENGPSTVAETPIDVDESELSEQPIEAESEPVEESKPEPPGGLTENTPGQTDRVRQALENAKARPKPQEPEPVEADYPLTKDYLLVVHSDGRAHIHVTFCDSAATRNIWLDDQFDSLITPSVAADLAHHLRTMPTHIQEVLERLERRAHQSTAETGPPEAR